MYDCVHLVFVVAVVMFLYITWRWLPMRVYRCVEYSVHGVGTTVGPVSPGGVHVCVGVWSIVFMVLVPLLILLALVVFMCV